MLVRVLRFLVVTEKASVSSSIEQSQRPRLNVQESEAFCWGRGRTWHSVFEQDEDATLEQARRTETEWLVLKGNDQNSITEAATLFPDPPSLASG